MEKEDFLAIASREYDQWVSEQSKKPKTDVYEYEKDFSDLMNRLGHHLFQASLGVIPSNHRKKNDSFQIRKS